MPVTGSHASVSESTARVRPIFPDVVNTLRRRSLIARNSVTTNGTAIAMAVAVRRKTKSASRSALALVSVMYTPAPIAAAKSGERTPAIRIR